MAKGFLDGYNTYDTSKGYGNAKKWRTALKERMSREQAAAILQQEEETPYSLLGISPQATATEIKKAFRLRIVEWHPDKNQHRIQEVEAMSKKIIAAYTWLTS
jgi:DnaJ-class molecular chaperone